MSDFPIIFNIGGSSRHEVILINAGYSIEDISKKVESLATSSQNCQEPLAKYKKKGEEKVTAIKVCMLLSVRMWYRVTNREKVRWSAEGRDSRLFPKSTFL